ncbi:CMGC/SRPK protein kinase, variant [Hyaloraphidium curvatum]|nr:CMGC/SRPK protein kinase, variant [Hyaloraphidium curvatum]
MTDTDTTGTPAPEDRRSARSSSRSTSGSSRSASASSVLSSESSPNYSEEEEDEEDYTKGGYHPVRLGDEFDVDSKDGTRYKVVRKLGWGHFSTVWLGKDVMKNRLAALKIVKSAPHYTETALDEIKLLERVVRANPSSPNRKAVVELYDWFKCRGTNGTHVVMAFEPLGPNLLTLIRSHSHRGIPIPIVKRITKQVLMGLDYLHRECGIIHTDLKPENVLCGDGNTSMDVDRPQPSPSSSSKGKDKSKDKDRKLRGGLVIPSHPIKKFGPSDSASSMRRALREREKRENASEDKSGGKKRKESDAEGEADAEGGGQLGKDKKGKKKLKKERSHRFKKSSSSILRVKIADLGNACWVDHHFTADIQTRQYRSPEAILGAKYGTSADMWSLGCMVFELLTGDYLFDPQAGGRYSKDDDHMAQIVELLGPFPKHLALAGKYSMDIFNRKGELRHIHKLRYWSLNDVLHEKYRFPRPVADEIAAFIIPMIDLNPDRRATAQEMLQSEWLRDVEVSDDEDGGPGAEDGAARGEARPAENGGARKDGDGDEGM